VASLFAVLRWFLSLKVVEEGELGAGDVLHLFPEGADSLELADCGDVGIPVFRHGFSEPDKIPFRKLERAADALRDGLRNVIRRGSFLVAEVCGVPDVPTAERAMPHKMRGATTRKRLILASVIRKKDT
jgi:hypothetical protein